MINWVSSAWTLAGVLLGGLAGWWIDKLVDGPWTWPLIIAAALTIGVGMGLLEYRIERQPADSESNP